MLANRLTENPKWNVLLIEAGDVETPMQDVPVAAPYSVFTRYNWGYLSEPQSEACLGNYLEVFKDERKTNRKKYCEMKLPGHHINY